MKAIINAIKTFVHIHLNAYKTATILDDCVRVLGTMSHPHSDTKINDSMLMNTKQRQALIDRACWHALPTWKWRSN